MPSTSRKDGGLAKMSFDEFLQWSQSREGRWELHDGVPVRLHDPAKMHSERVGHINVKFQMALALHNALLASEVSCHMLSDGATVKIDRLVSYEPDALVYCGERLGDNEIVVKTPVIIVEALSPSTAYKDVSTKLADYFKLPSVAHYLILDPAQKRIQHYYRDGEGIRAALVAIARPLRLTPPGITLSLENIFA